jgi:hypothetical protein
LSQFHEYFPKKSDTGYRLLSKNKAKFDERHGK